MYVGRPQNLDSSSLRILTYFTHSVSFGSGIGGITWSRTIRTVWAVLPSRRTLIGAL